METGIVFSIEEFAVNDGPGIRSTVFLKGCPLRCTWCHNPEGQNPRPELMVKKGVHSICGYEITPQALADQLKRNGEIFRMNNGGVTFTGGEPLSQHEFLVRTLELLRPGIHCAVETSAFASEEVFRKVLSNLDLVLMDVKIVDAQLHRKFTGVDNAPILRNLEILKASGVPFIIRIPLIPGVNDTEENLSSTALLLKDVPSLIRVELLPYHKTAGAKYPMVGREYDPGFDVNAAPHARIRPFDEAGIDVLVV